MANLDYRKVRKGMVFLAKIYDRTKDGEFEIYKPRDLKKRKFNKLDENCVEWKIEKDLLDIYKVQASVWYTGEVYPGHYMVTTYVKKGSKKYLAFLDYGFTEIK